MGGINDSKNSAQQVAWSRLWAMIVSRVAHGVAEDTKLQEVLESPPSEDSCAGQGRT
jgi:hypothetical protein